MVTTTKNYTPVMIADTLKLSADEWLERRREGIGGSDAAAVLGLSPFCTARDICVFLQVGTMLIIRHN